MVLQFVDQLFTRLNSPRHGRRSLSRAVQLGLLAALMLVGVSACGGLNQNLTQPSAPLPAADCHTIEHDAGQTTLCGQPRTIAALSPHILDMMLALGVEPAAYADTSAANHRQFDQPANQIRYLGSRLTQQPLNLGDRHSPALEMLTLVQPDLILGEFWQGAQGKYELFSQIAPTALFADQPEGGWRWSIHGLAQALDRQANVQPIIAAQARRIAAARTTLAPIAAAHPRMLLLSSGSLASGFYVFGDEPDLYSTLIEKLGFQLVHLHSSDTPISVETLSQTNADMIVVISWDEADDENPSAWQRRQQEWSQIPVLSNLPVSQEGRVYFMDAHLTTLRGPIAEKLILQDLLNLLVPSNSGENS